MNSPNLCVSLERSAGSSAFRSAVNEETSLDTSATGTVVAFRYLSKSEIIDVDSNFSPEIIAVCWNNSL